MDCVVVETDRPRFRCSAIDLQKKLKKSKGECASGAVTGENNVPRQYRAMVCTGRREQKREIGNEDVEERSGEGILGSKTIADTKTPTLCESSKL